MFSTNMDHILDSLLPEKGSFPYYVAESFGRELIQFSCDKKEDLDFLKLLNEEDQMFDQALACVFAEKHIKKFPLINMSPEELEVFLKEINAIAGRTLYLLSTQGLQAGQYAEKTCGITQETGVEDCDFEPIEVYSTHNEKILRKLYGDKIAKDYKSFCLVLADKYQTWGMKQLESKKDPNELARFVSEYALDQRSDFYAYQRVVKFSNPTKAHENVLNFCKQLLVMIKQKKDPIACAAFTLYHLINIHPFLHGNKRTTRILMNSILLSLNTQPIVLPKDKILLCNWLIQKLQPNDLSKLENLLKTSVRQSNPMEPLLKKKFGKLCMLNGRFDRPMAVALYADSYELIPNHNLEAYQREKMLAGYSEQLTGGLYQKEFSQDRSKLVASVINGTICFEKAKQLEATHPLYAHYLYDRSARFFDAEKNDKMSNSARRKAAHCSPAKTIEFKDEMVTRAQWANNNKIENVQLDIKQRYLERLKFNLGSDIVRLPKDRRGCVAFPLMWLRQLSDDTKDSIASELKIDKADLNPNF